MATTITAERLLNVKQISELAGIPYSTAYVVANRKGFPEPVIHHGVVQLWDSRHVVECFRSRGRKVKAG